MSLPAPSTLANLVVWAFVALAAADVLISDARREGIEVGWGHAGGLLAAQEYSFNSPCDTRPL